MHELLSVEKTNYEVCVLEKSTGEVCSVVKVFGIIFQCSIAARGVWRPLQKSTVLHSTALKSLFAHKFRYKFPPSALTGGQEWFLIFPTSRVWLKIWADLRISGRVNYFLPFRVLQSKNFWSYILMIVKP